MTLLDTRFKKMCWLIMALFVVSLASRAGTATDSRARAHCTAIGAELRRRAADKSIEMKTALARPDLSAANRKSIQAWQVYIDHIDAMGRVLVDNFSDPQPPSDDDWAHVQNLDLVPLTHEGEGCTG